MVLTFDQTAVVETNNNLPIPCLTLPPETKDTLSVWIQQGTTPYSWKDLHSSPEIDEIHVIGNANRKPSTEDVVTELALNLRTFTGRIKIIEFRDCQVEELVHLWVATTSNSPTFSTNAEAVAASAPESALEPSDDSNDKDDNALLALSFKSCIIANRAARTLNLMLQGQSLAKLVFDDCQFDREAAQTIQEGLAKNLSLGQFKCTFNYRNNFSDYLPSPIEGVSLSDMLNTTTKLVKLSLSVNNDNAQVWHELRSAHESKSLQSLQIHKSLIYSAPVEAVLMRCLVMKSLKEIDFSYCRFTKQATDVLLKALSSNSHVIDTLTFDHVACFRNDGMQYEYTCGSLQVRKLVLRGTGFGPQTWTRVVNDMGNNQVLQCLHIQSSRPEWVNHINELCEVVLGHNRGPSELILEDIDVTATNLPEVLQHDNTRVTTLSISLVGSLNMDSFARGLANMRGLRKLSFNKYDDTDDFDDKLELFVDELIRSLEWNTSLRTISFAGLEHIWFLDHHVYNLRYWLAINRLGRHILMAHPTLPLGMWPHILAKTAKEAAGIYFVLREQPDLFLSEQSRKRKRCEEIAEMK